MHKAEFFRQVIDAMVTAVVVLDDDLRIRFMNAAAEHLLHLSENQAQDAPIRDFILLSDGVFETLKATLESGQPFTARDATIRLPDNISEEVDFTVARIDLGKGPGLLAELQPLTRLKRINKDDESIVRQETTRQLVRGLAHEVKNPLGGIRGAAQLLEQELTDATLTEYTGVIISEADRLKLLVDRMLGPNTGLNIGPVNLHKVTEHVISVIEAELPGVISWQRDYDPSLPDLEGDENQLIQAVMNIVRNATEALADTQNARISFCSRGIRQFTIGNHRHRLVMRLDIYDNGPGIDPELEPRIFFPMISGHADGSGLGLAITQNIVIQHHGSIQVNTRPGQTCFTIYLPFEYDPEAASSTAEINGALEL